ncbi:hypothetical protein ACIBHX_48895 [Nonomuraea sp. NPDC050536]|uniref:hypothetical protein n=1 Tax=Nonomuraea sp. NPDC050536 TaxID=3364366 RepID=UPI0037C8407F
MSVVPNTDVRAAIGVSASTWQLRDVLDRVGDKWSVLVTSVSHRSPPPLSE